MDFARDRSCETDTEIGYPPNTSALGEEAGELEAASVDRLEEALGRPPRILIAEDHASTRTATAILLSFEGFETRSVADGVDLIDALRPLALREPIGWSPDLLMLDVGLRRLDGLYVLENLRQLHADIPTIVTTGFADRRTLERVAALDKVRYFQKPTTPDRLIRVSREMIGERADLQQPPPAGADAEDDSRQNSAA